MKAFEEWWDLSGLAEHINLVQGDGSYERVPNFNLKKEQKIAWNAAFINMQQWLMGRRCTGEDVLDYINKELHDCDE